MVLTDQNLFTCSQDTQEKIKEVISEHSLNRVVVAACSPTTHEALFQDSLTESGLNKYLFDMANIRNQNSWVHRRRPRFGNRKGQRPHQDVRRANRVSSWNPLTGEKNHP